MAISGPLSWRTRRTPTLAALALAAGLMLAAAVGASSGASAETYPSRPAKILIGFPPGGPACPILLTADSLLPIRDRGREWYRASPST